MDSRFWLKTLLYRFTPGGFGKYRKLLRHRDDSYDHERDKHLTRQKHHSQEGWQDSDGDVVYRNYADYGEYIDHQKQKFDEILKITGGFSNKVVADYRLRFYSRFKTFPSFLPMDAVIVCVGARQGTEVEVLRDLGFRNAYGIDLNPGPDNPWVRQGDFMNMKEASSSVDLIYTNCVDHAFDLDQFFSEHARVVKPDGYALYDLPPYQESGGGRGPFEAVTWKRDEDIFLQMLQHFERVIKVETAGWKWILLQGTRHQPTDPGKS